MQVCCSLTKVILQWTGADWAGQHPASLWGRCATIQASMNPSSQLHHSLFFG